ncbi:hypothetical protein [Tautonia marina]|nr:hypothetical protein [Tautonia marina]
MTERQELRDALLIPKLLLRRFCRSRGDLPRAVDMVATLRG